MKPWLNCAAIIWMFIYQLLPSSDAAPAASSVFSAGSNANNENSTNLKAALYAVNRVRRDARHPVPRSLVRYRYPLHIKRTYFNPNFDESPSDYEPQVLANGIRDEFGFHRHAQHFDPAERSVGAALRTYNDYIRTTQGQHKLQQLLNKLDEESLPILLRHLDNDQAPEFNFIEDETADSLAQEDTHKNPNRDTEEEAIAAILEELASEITEPETDDMSVPEFANPERKRAVPRAAARWRARYVTEPDKDQDGLMSRHGFPEEDNSINADAGSSRGFHRNRSGFRDQWRSPGKRSGNVPSGKERKRSTQHVQRFEENAQEQASHLSSPNEQPSLRGPVRKRRQAEMEQPRALPVLAEAKAQINASKTMNLTGSSTHAPKKHRSATSVPRRENFSKLSPKNVQKKSVDWDDYFGIDKRSDADLRDWLESEYYKAIAGSLASRRKRSDKHAHSKVMKKRNSVPRHLDSDIDDLGDRDEFKLAKLENDDQGESDQEGMQRWREQQASGPTPDDTDWENARSDDEDLDFEEFDAENERNDEDTVLSRRRRRRQLNNLAKGPAEARYVADLIDRMSVTELRELVADLKRLQQRLAAEEAWEDLTDDEVLEEGFLPGKDWEENTEESDEGEEEITKQRRSLRKRYPFDVEKRAGVLPSLEPQYASNSLDDYSSDVACPVLRQILPVCHVVSQITGDYHNLFMDACNHHQACLLCVNEDVEKNSCMWTFNEQSEAICQGDLICLSRARRMAQALRSLHEQDDDADFAHVACQRDACVARYLKKR